MQKDQNSELHCAKNKGDAADLNMAYTYAMTNQGLWPKEVMRFRGCQLKSMYDSSLAPKKTCEEDWYKGMNGTGAMPDPWSNATFSRYSCLEQQNRGCMAVSAGWKSSSPDKTRMMM